MATFRQRLTAQKILDNTGISVSKAMEEVGYKPGSFKNPQQLTQSNGWKELTKGWFQDEDVARVQAEMLHAVRRKRYLFPLSTPDKEIREIIEFDDSFKLIYIERRKRQKVAHYLAPDHHVIGNALDLIYRIKGRYALGKMIAKRELTHDPYEDMTDEELVARIRELEKENPVCRYCLQPKPKIEQSPPSERITPP